MANFDGRIIQNDFLKVHCKHFVNRKKRYCRITPNEGEDYCGEHQVTVKYNETVHSNAETKIRIVCPLDEKHTCYAHNLKKHLKICNAKPQEQPHFIKEGINAGKNESPGSSNDCRFLSSFSTLQIKNVIAKVNEVYEAWVSGKIVKKCFSYHLLEEEMEKLEYGHKTKKHLKQVSAILGILQEFEMLKSHTSFIEFGAGRGQLSFWIANATEYFDNVSIVLVERSSPKHKWDNKLNKNNEHVQRIKADIANLVLDNMDTLSKPENIIAVTKHLCGDATDLALRCIINSKEMATKVKGLVMTFCCHHRCTWSSYVGKEFFREVCLEKEDFEILCCVASWATCGDGFNREKRKNMNDVEPANDVSNQRVSELGLNHEQKEEVGKRCKNVLNWGRLRFLEKSGFECSLYYYVEANISLENVCILAKKKD